MSALLTRIHGRLAEVCAGYFSVPLAVREIILLERYGEKALLPFWSPAAKFSWICLRRINRQRQRRKKY